MFAGTSISLFVGGAAFVRAEFFSRWNRTFTLRMSALLLSHDCPLDGKVGLIRVPLSLPTFFLSVRSFAHSLPPAFGAHPSATMTLEESLTRSYRGIFVSDSRGYGGVLLCDGFSHDSSLTTCLLSAATCPTRSSHPPARSHAAR